MKKIIFILSILFIFNTETKKDVYVIRNGQVWYDFTKSRDGVDYFFEKWKKTAEKEGYNLQQVSPNSDFSHADCVIWFDANFIHNASRVPKQKNVLFLWEPPVVYPCNGSKDGHEAFNQIYVQRDDWVDNKRYFKFYNPYPIFKITDKAIAFKNKKLCCMLLSSPVYKPTTSFYQARRPVVEFFKKHAPQDFDLYGNAWEYMNYQNYKGYAPVTVDVCKNYKFAFCYENSNHMSGYITDRIWGAFASGTVPIYWGATNIEEYVPKNCFIDKRDFDTYEELYDFLKNITEDEYNQYLQNIKEFLASEKTHIFSHQHFVDIIMNAIRIACS